VDPERQQVFVGDRTGDYDFLVIATGHRSENEAVPGLGPFDGPGPSLMSPPGDGGGGGRPGQVPRRHRPHGHRLGLGRELPGSGPLDQTPIPANFSKTGHMTVQMARAAARNIAVDIRGGERTTRPPFVRCILDMGDRAAHIIIGEVLEQDELVA